MERVFRIRQWKSAGVILPNRYSEFMKNNRHLFDDERKFNLKIKQLKRQADRVNQEHVRFVFLGEEFLDGAWQVIYTYPEDFDHDLL